MQHLPGVHIFALEQEFAYGGPEDPAAQTEDPCPRVIPKSPFARAMVHVPFKPVLQITCKKLRNKVRL